MGWRTFHHQSQNRVFGNPWLLPQRRPWCPWSHGDLSPPTVVFDLLSVTKISFPNSPVKITLSSCQVQLDRKIYLWNIFRLLPWFTYVDVTIDDNILLSKHDPPYIPITKTVIRSQFGRIFFVLQVSKSISSRPRFPLVISLANGDPPRILCVEI